MTKLAINVAVCRNEEVRVQGKAVARAVFLLQGLLAADRKQEFYTARSGSGMRSVLRGTVRSAMHEMQRGQ